jgi:hypothetical protein
LILSQGLVQGVYRTFAKGGGMFELPSHADLDGRLGHRVLIFTLLLIDYAEAYKLKVFLARTHRFVDKKLETRLRRFELEPLVFEIFELFEHLHCHRIAL